jgi:Uma2 family endonuclease
MSTIVLERPQAKQPRHRPAFDGGLRVPPLDNGYRLAQPEFHRRYSQMPEVKRAELIEGTVFMGSPLSYAHGNGTKMLLTWLGCYEASTPGVGAADNATLILDLDNEYQPDALLRLGGLCGGKSWLEDNYLPGPPELVVEVSLISVTQDLGNKLKVYRRHGVPEYLVWQLGEQRFDWFVLRDADYVPLAAGPHGSLRSVVFPGLWLDAQALLAGDLKGVLKHLQKGLDSAEHAAFVKKLAKK